MTPEGKIKQHVRKLLKEYHCDTYWFCPVQNGMGKQGLDFMHIQMPGVPVFAIETKAPGKHPTMRQNKTINEIVNAGGMVFVIDGDCSELIEWLDHYDIPDDGQSDNNDDG